MITYYFPRAENVLKGVAQHALFKYGMQTSKPLEVSEDVNNQKGTPDFKGLEFSEGVPYLTQLSLEGSGVKFVFEECVLSLNMEKNIITTPLQGSNGTVKEYISDGDYSITMNTAISTYKKDESEVSYPIDTLKGDIKKLLKLPQSLKVKSEFLAAFDITDVVVKNYTINQETHSNRQSLQLQLLSDITYEIQLKENV